MMMMMMMMKMMMIRSLCFFCNLCCPRLAREPLICLCKLLSRLGCRYATFATFWWHKNGPIPEALMEPVPHMKAETHCCTYTTCLDCFGKHYIFNTLIGFNKSWSMNLCDDICRSGYQAQQKCIETSVWMAEIRFLLILPMFGMFRFVSVRFRFRKCSGEVRWRVGTAFHERSGGSPSWWWTDRSMVENILYPPGPRPKCFPEKRRPFHCE